MTVEENNAVQPQKKGRKLTASAQTFGCQIFVQGFRGFPAVAAAVGDKNVIKFHKATRLSYLSLS